MSKYLVLLLLVWLACPVRIFLFGSILMYDNNLAYKRLAQETGKPIRPDACPRDWQMTDCPKVAVITSACPDSQCGEEEYYIGDDEEAPTGDFFLKLGMVPRHVTVHVDNYEVAADPFTEEGQRNLEIISQADVIYFNGGDQSRHMRSWFNDDGTPNPLFSVLRNRVLKDDVIVVGVSAGTAVNSKIIYGGGSSFGILYFSNSVGLAPNSVANGAGLDDLRNGTDCLQYQENGAKLDGFGFVTDFQIDTHFDRRGRLGRLIPVLAELKTPIGVGIDQQACFFYKDGVGTVYGNNGVFIVDLTDAYKITSKYFQMRNIRVHYLTQGDTFNIKARQLTTTKPIIQTPAFSEYADSNKILSKYECTRLITRLVDQRALFNLGKTVTPEDEDYPAETPRFDFIFYKEDETKGYKKDNRYTVVNAYVDLTAEVRNR